MSDMRYVTISKAAEVFGVGEEKIRQNIQGGRWRKGIQWRKAPDGRVIVDLAEVRGLLDDAFDPDAHDSADLYDAQGVNQAHRVAAGGVAPRETAAGEVE